jgi:Zn-dependent M28 family amino/carboxypeptidase
MSGSPNRLAPLPSLVISHEDYALLARLVERGTPRGNSDPPALRPSDRPTVQARVENRIGKTPVRQFNTVAQIRGTQWPGQTVILGAHLDSWDLGTGVTDNGTGSMVVLEAARIIAQSGLKPKRSIRFILFSGEEQGLIGSRAYAEAHAREADSIQAVLVIDNGTGAITGQALQGREDLKGLWQQLLAPVAHLDADSIRSAVKSGTDHLSFLPYGIPGFNFDQLPRGYNHTHHSQSDTYDKAVEGDLKQAAAVMAVTAWELANLPELLPRGPKSPVPPVPNKPSPGIAARR